MFVRKGNTMNYVCTAAVERDEVVKVGDMYGIAACAGAIGDEIALYVTEVFAFAAEAVAMNQGKAVYWDSTNKKVVATAPESTTPVFGKVWTEKEAAGTTVEVSING